MIKNKSKMNQSFVVIINQGFKQTEIYKFTKHEDAYSCFCDRLINLEDHLTISMEMQRT